MKGHSKIDKTKSFITDGSLMKVESIAELHFFRPALSNNCLENQVVVFLRVVVQHRFYCMHIFSHKKDTDLFFLEVKNKPH